MEMTETQKLYTSIQGFNRHTIGHHGRAETETNGIANKKYRFYLKFRRRFLLKLFNHSQMIISKIINGCIFYNRHK